MVHMEFQDSGVKEESLDGHRWWADIDGGQAAMGSSSIPLQDLNQYEWRVDYCAFKGVDDGSHDEVS